MTVVYKKFEVDEVKMTEDLNITIVLKDMLLFMWHQVYAQGDFPSAEAIDADLSEVIDVWKKNHEKNCKGLEMGGLNDEQMVVDFDKPPRGANDLMSKPPILEEILKRMRNKRVIHLEEKRLSVSFMYNGLIEEINTKKNIPA